MKGYLYFIAFTLIGINCLKQNQTFWALGFFALAIGFLWHTIVENAAKQGKIIYQGEEAKISTRYYRTNSKNQSLFNTNILCYNSHLYYLLNKRYNVCNKSIQKKTIKYHKYK